MTPKRGYSCKFPVGKTHGRYSLDQIPAGLWRSAKARAKREGVSIRSILLEALSRFVRRETLW